jgi:hypothetical protein
MRLFAAAMAVFFALGMFSVGSTVSARSIQVPARASVQAPYVTHAITVAKKKKKAKKKKAKDGVGTAYKVADSNSSSAGIMRLTVKLTGVVDSATESDGLSLLPAGDKLVAAELTFSNSNVVIQLYAGADMTLVDSHGNSYLGDLAVPTVSQCQQFADGVANLAPGDIASGCVVFEIPTGASPARLQYVPIGGTLYEWKL